MMPTFGWFLLAAAIGEAVFYPVEVAKVRLQAARRSPDPW